MGRGRKRSEPPPARSVDIPPEQLIPDPESGVTVAKAESFEELRKLIHEAAERNCHVAAKRSIDEPVSSLAMVPGSVVIVPNYLNNESKVDVTVSEGAAPRIKLTRMALVRDLVAEQLGNASIRNAFLPVGADPNKAVLSVLFRNNDPREPRNYFQRSTDPLRSSVQSLSYLPLSSTKDVDPVEWDKDSSTPLCFDDKFVLDAIVQVDPSKARMEVRRLLFLYDRTVFESEIMDAFLKNYPGALAQGKIDGVDLTVEVFNLPMYVASQLFILITACSSMRRQDEAIEALFPELRSPLQSQLLVDPIDIHSMGPGDPERRKAFNLPAKEYGGTFSAGDFDAVSDWLKKAANAAAYDINQNLQAHFRLLSDNSVYANALIFDADPRAHSRRSMQFPDVNRSHLEELSAPVVSIPTRGVREETSALAERAKELPPPVGLENVEVIKPDHSDYEKLRAQYASFKESYRDASFMPFFIVRPQDSDQITKVINYALKEKKKVVVRSGGHQYCGFSSGNEDYIQVLMDNMNDKKIEVSFKKALNVKKQKCSILSPDGPGDDAQQWFVTVAARCRLEDVSQMLLDNKLTIPHGECPLVGIGGHVQTGGYGHQMRGLGLCLDYVYSFDMVVLTEKENDVSARLVTVYRPELELDEGDAPGKDQGLNNLFYKGVLGGSPGAFGVITRIKFLAVHDNDPAVKGSHNVQAIYPYQGWDIQSGAAPILRMMLDFASSKKLLPEGLDVFISIISKPIAYTGFEWGIVIPELAYTGAEFSDAIKDQMIDILNCCKAKAIWGIKDIIRQKLMARPPSKVAHHGVRTVNSGVTKNGREFDLPYKKRVNVMLDSDELSGEKAYAFAEEFGKLMADVILDHELLLVVQMNLGGGKVLSNDNERRTGIPYRNQTFGFVFDVFYKPSAASRANVIQQRMTQLLDDTGGFSYRLFWGSYGREEGETDMSQPNVQMLYFGTEEAYEMMQEIKNNVDPNGIFTTDFTVQNST
jgi:hypothetical protein